MYQLIDFTKKTKIDIYQELFNLSKESIDSPLRLTLAGLSNKKMTDNELVEILTNLSNTIKELPLNVASVKIHFHGSNYEVMLNELQLLNHFSKDIPQLEVSLMEMHMINEDLIKVISQLSTISAPLHLSLSNNMSDGMRFCENPLTLELCQAAAALPKLQSLSFSGFDFNPYNTDFIVEAFKAVSTKTLLSLDLSYTRIDFKPVAEIKKILAAIPENVTCLNLGPWRTKKTSDELKDIFSTLRGTKITEINEFIEDIQKSNENARPGLMLRHLGLFNNDSNQPSTSTPTPLEVDALTYAARRHLKDKAMTPIKTDTLDALHAEMKLLQSRVNELESSATEALGIR